MIKRPHLLLLATLTGLTCVGLGRAGDERKKADLAKLADTALWEAEVARLAGCDGKEKFLKAWRFHRCPQKDGTDDLHVLAADYEYDFQRKPSFSPGGSYTIDAPEELFGKDPGADGLSAPSLARVSDHLLLVFGSDGNELKPFGGDNSIKRGYLFDFNRDGIMERADSSNREVAGADDHDIQVFELKTIEREPKTLLQVIFNWHHEEADEINDWDFTCYDQENDGRVEIAFGPKSAANDAELRRFVFRWDESTKSYSADEIPEHSHIRVVQPGETLEQIAKAGGLDYPIEGETSDDPFAPKLPASRPPQKPYTFASLKGASDAELLAFFRGKQRRDSFFGAADSFETRLSPGFWEMSPKEAALAFVEANRTPSHRRHWKLAIDDRNAIAPPESGWWLHDWNSSGCYSFSKHVFALRFGVTSPVLLATDYNSQGMVGRNPLVDQPGSTARLIPLSEKEARFLSDTLFWMDRIRSHEIEERDGPMGGSYSTADGFATLHLAGDGIPARKVASDTIWAMSSVSSNWKEDYAPEICLNLIEHLLASALPAHLGDRWKVAPEIDRRSLSTPLDQRLAPRHDVPARDQLVDVLTRTFERHFKEPIPAPALAELVECAGQEAILELKPALERLNASLPPAGVDDKEFETLEKRFSRDHFGNPRQDDPSDHPKDYQRYQELMEMRSLAPGPVLRDPLNRALEQLRLAVSSKLLMKAVRDNGEYTQWALDRLRRNFPAMWKDHLIGEFQHANLEEQRNIFETIATASPQAAKDLLALISPKKIDDMLIEVAEFQIEHDPKAVTARIPALIAIVRETTGDYLRRGKAIELMGRIELKPDDVANLAPLLLAELKTPEKKNDFTRSYTFCAAIETLSRLPGAKAHLDAIARITDGGYGGFDSGIDALMLLTEGAADRQSRLEAFVRPRLKKHDGMMNEVFLTALALDLRGLAPEIAAMASESPAVQDGDGANYGGGNFKGPVGEHYHIAREITALWNEPDPATRSRLWIASIVSHPDSYESRQPSDKVRRLRDRATAAIGELPQESRKQTIEAMITASPALPQHYPETTGWLREMAAK